MLDLNIVLVSDRRDKPSTPEGPPTTMWDRITAVDVYSGISRFPILFETSVSPTRICVYVFRFPFRCAFFRILFISTPKVLSNEGMGISHCRKTVWEENTEYRLLRKEILVEIATFTFSEVIWIPFILRTDRNLLQGRLLVTVLLGCRPSACTHYFKKYKISRYD